MNCAPSLVWLAVDHRTLGTPGSSQPFVVLGEKYTRAVQDGANAQPVLFPLAAPEQLEPLLALVDGVVLPGSPANVHPSHYGQDVLDPSLPLDPQRDTLTLPLIQACIKFDVPLLGICRGFQEMNVALGGSLHQQVHAVPGLMDHRETKSMSLEDQYAPSHSIRLQEGSILQTWAQGALEVQVNSLHGQGIDRLAPGLQALAFAPDGLIEAVGINNAGTFAYSFQFHPEWRCLSHPFYRAIFAAFGQACSERKKRRLGIAPVT